MEISASGYTKEMQEDDDLLQPEGPDCETQDADSTGPPTEDFHLEPNLDNNNDKSLSEAMHGTSLSDSTPASEPEYRNDKSIDLSDFHSALAELEGQTGDGKHKSITENPVTADDDDRLKKGISDDDVESQDGDEEDEHGDECPDLVVLSGANKEYRPFR